MTRHPQIVHGTTSPNRLRATSQSHPQGDVPESSRNDASKSPRGDIPESSTGRHPRITHFLDIQDKNDVIRGRWHPDTASRKPHGRAMHGHTREMPVHIYTLFKIGRLFGRLDKLRGLLRSGTPSNSPNNGKNDCDIQKMCYSGKATPKRGRAGGFASGLASGRACVRPDGQPNRRESDNPASGNRAPRCRGAARTQTGGRQPTPCTRQADAGAALAPGRQVPHLRAAYLSSASIRR